MQYSELIEKKKHGTPDFPIEYYYIDRSHPRYIMATHWHKEFELIRVLSGRLTVYLNTVKYDLLPGQCVFVEGGCLKWALPENCVYECLVFDTALLGKGEQTLLLEEGEHSYKNLIATEDAQILDSIDRLFTSAREEKPYYRLEVVSLLSGLFYRLHLSGYITQNRNYTTDRKLRTVISLLKWIEKNNTQEITLQKIADYAGLTPKYLCRIFKNYTSKTIMDYVNESRIERSCIELLHNSVTEAAFNCGFNDVSYFCKTFKKHKGMTPKEYKKQYEMA